MIDLWFPTAIYRDNLSKDFGSNEYLKHKAEKLIFHEKNTQTQTQWRCDTLSTIEFYNWEDDNDSEIQKLISLIKLRILEFATNFGIDPSIELRCNGCWFNIALPTSYQEYHQHCNSHFSAVYYIDVREKSGNIVFKSLESVTDMCSLPVNSNNLTNLSYKTCSYAPKNYDLYIFRSNLLHMVEKNQSKNNRISISMNFGFL